MIEQKKEETTGNEVVSGSSREPQFAAYLAIDWADQEHVWCLQAAGAEKRETGKVKNRTEELEAWISQICQRFAPQPIAVAMEKCRGTLLCLLTKYQQLHLYPIAPQAAYNFRKALHPSGATDDARDADALLEMLCRHRERWQRWVPDNEETRLLQGLVEERRRLVDHRTGLLNCLTAKLKIYFPQMLEWFERLDSGLVYALLQRWPTLPELQKVGAATLRRFFHKHHCRQNTRMEERIAAIRRATPALQDRAVVQAQAAIVKALASMLLAAGQGIRSLEKQIEEAANLHPDFSLFDSFPGAGEVLVPRLIVAFGSQRERYSSSGDLQSFSGIAPVREQSGKSQWTHFRYGCPKFLRQTFHEWAGHSLAHCSWARAYYQQQCARGKGHHAAVRALAFKWIRIAFRCWKDRVPYDENIYLASLKRKQSSCRLLAADTPQ